MRSSIPIYFRLLAQEIRAQLQYPVSFLFEIISYGFVVSLFFVSLALILQRFENIAGWTLGEIAFLYGTIEASFGIMDMIFSGFDPRHFGEQVRRGRFDIILLRPVNLTLQVLGSEFVVRRLGRVVQGIVIFTIGLSLTEIQWTLSKIIFMPVVWSSLICFFGGLFIIGATVTFWTIESIEAINILTYGGSEMMSYPMSIYHEWMRRFFTFIVPAIFLNYYPTLWILDKIDPLGFPDYAPFLAPVVGIGTLLIALQFWRYGIRHYQSTGT